MADFSKTIEAGPPIATAILEISRAVVVDLVVKSGKTVLHRNPVITPGVTITIEPGGELILL